MIVGLMVRCAMTYCTAPQLVYKRPHVAIAYTRKPCHLYFMTILANMVRL